MTILRFVIQMSQMSRLSRALKIYKYGAVTSGIGTGVYMVYTLFPLYRTVEPWPAKTLTGIYTESDDRYRSNRRYSSYYDDHQQTCAEKIVSRSIDTVFKYPAYKLMANHTFVKVVTHTGETILFGTLIGLAGTLYGATWPVSIPYAALSHAETKWGVKLC